MKTRWTKGVTRGAMLLTIVALAAAFSACGDDGTDDPGDPAATTTASAGDTTPDAGEDATPEPTTEIEETQEPEETSVFELEVGDCITSSFGDDTEVEGETGVVPCDDPQAQAEVVDLVDVPDADEYPEESYFDQEALNLCPDFTDSFYFPTSESWDEGDRTIICLRSVS